VKFEVYNRGRLATSLDTRKEALAYVDERRKGERPSEQRLWEIRPENPFKVVDRSGRVIASFTTRREADAVRSQLERRDPGSRPSVVGGTLNAEASLIKPRD